ncbi:MAG: guanylate kinase [Thermodesulfovibrio sp. RBG_19FT_COMBO_42_12]|nr:MAG: guanylate kinase [Thermodesulfovibrio sp. RBG_19FT_COMBO_42_12]
MQERKNRGSLFIVSAPSGSGKTTLCKKLVSSLPNLKFSVSYTTRHPRPGEVNNRDYTFITRNEFMSMVDKKEFIEWAEIHGEFYGTSKKMLEELIGSGIDVILDIDTQGAMQLKKKYGEGTYIFVLPPSIEVLRERLEKRMTDLKEEIEKRLKMASVEIKSYYTYDYVIINDTFEDALKELESIIISHRAITKMINPLWIEERFKIGG